MGQAAPAGVCPRARSAGGAYHRRPVLAASPARIGERVLRGRHAQPQLSRGTIGGAAARGP
eukprot:10676904-Lingulodinium_polyedra.AAC.1